MLADRPIAITNKSWVIKTTHGDIFVSKDHRIHEGQAPCNFLELKDDGAIYWLNPDHIVYIGPR